MNQANRPQSESQQYKCWFKAKQVFENQIKDKRYKNLCLTTLMRERT